MDVREGRARALNVGRNGKSPLLLKEEDYGLWLPWQNGTRRFARLPNVGMADCLIRFLRYPFAQESDQPLNLVDAGACVGAFVLAAKKFLPNSTVLAFEPYAPCWPYLSENVGDLPGVRIIKRALGSERGRKRIGRPAGANVTIGQTSFYGNLSETHEIEVVKLDDIVQGTVHLMKIDVEGAELDVLRGAERVLRESHPSLLIEVKNRNQARAGRKAEDVVEHLAASGYGPPQVMAYGDWLFHPVERPIPA